MIAFVKRLIFRNFWLKLFSLGLAALVYYALSGATKAS